MKKYSKLVSIISLSILSGSAFALPNTPDSALESVMANTDAQLAPAANGAMERFQAPGVPAPSMERAVSRSVQLVDITEKCTQGGEVVSAYPAIYQLIQKEENSRIIKVFRFTDAKGTERRVEVLFTGGDWMQYGLTYIVTNAGPDKGQVKAYFVNELSTSDREEGSVAPAVDPFDPVKLANFIAADFLDANGNVKAAFGSVAAAPASVN
jgi:hypothetical protein